MPCADTTLLLDLNGRGGVAMKQRAQALVVQILSSGQTLAITQFTLAELYVGMFKASNARAEEQRVRFLLQGFVVLPFSDDAARHFGQITSVLHRMGRPAGDMDVLIAATALAYGEPLITRNTAHFANVPGLGIIEY